VLVVEIVPVRVVEMVPAVVVEMVPVLVVEMVPVFVVEIVPCFANAVIDSTATNNVEERMHLKLFIVSPGKEFSLWSGPNTAQCIRDPNSTNYVKYVFKGRANLSSCSVSIRYCCNSWS
jgi:hypothetical protein